MNVEVKKNVQTRANDVSVHNTYSAPAKGTVVNDSRSDRVRREASKD